MLHTDVANDEIFDSEFPVDLFPKSLRSFVVCSVTSGELTPFIKELLGGLQSFCLVSESLWEHSFLYHCRNLRRLSFNHERPMDFSFLRSMPRLEHLADLSQLGISVEDAAAISREAPNLISLFLFLPPRGSSTVYFEKIGRALCYVKKLTFNGDNQALERLLHMFLSDHSLFRQVISLLFLADSVECIDISNQLRPRCTISQLHWQSALNSKQLCDVCWQRRNPDWTCSRCKCFVFALE